MNAQPWQSPAIVAAEAWPVIENKHAKCKACGQLVQHHYAANGAFIPFGPECPEAGVFAARAKEAA